MSELSEWIASLLSDFFVEQGWSEHFLVEVVIKGKKYQVFIDSDQGVTIGECQKVSRYLEGYLDDNQEVVDDYNLEVSSPGLDRPLHIKRQYLKNIGRRVEVVFPSGKKVEGQLVDADDDGFKIAVPHPDKRRKELVQMPYKYEQVKQVKIKITFS